MPFSIIQCYKCLDCGRTFEVQPVECICNKQSLFKGQKAGPFIIESSMDDSGNISAICILCGMTKTVHYTNMRKQVSCGCKPKHIEMRNITKEIVEYKCRRCKTITKECPPIVTWCCEEDDE